MANIPSGSDIDEATTSSTAFRIMDLPAEIRNRIYSYALPGKNNTHSRRVADFRFPALTAVSRQVRKETLPLLFAESNFVFNVGTNVVSLSDVSFTDSRKAFASMSGNLGFKKVVQCFLKDAGDSAIFRDVSFRIHFAPVVYYIRYRPEQPGDKTYAELRLVVDHGNVNAETIEEACHPRRKTPATEASKKYTADLDEVLRSATSTAQKIAARKGFKGFTMTDLRRIAKCFRAPFD